MVHKIKGIMGCLRFYASNDWIWPLVWYEWRQQIQSLESFYEKSGISFLQKIMAVWDPFMKMPPAGF